MKVKKYLKIILESFIFDEDEDIVRSLASFFFKDEMIKVDKVNEYLLNPKATIFQPDKTKIITVRPRTHKIERFKYELNDENFPDHLAKIRDYAYLSKKDDAFFTHMAKNFKIDFTYRHLFSDSPSQIESFFSYLETVLQKLYNLFRFFLGKKLVEKNHIDNFYIKKSTLCDLLNKVALIFENDFFDEEAYEELFDRFVQEKKTQKRNALNFEQFLSFLFELADVFYIERKISDNLTSAFKLFLDDHRIIKFANMIKEPVVWRQKTFVSKEITFLISFYHDILLELYQGYIKFQDSQTLNNSCYQNYFALEQKYFLRIVEKFQLHKKAEKINVDVLNKDEEFKKLGDMVDEEEAVRLCYIDSIRYKLVGSGLENLPLMLFPEFIEGILRLGNIYRLHKLVFFFLIFFRNLKGNCSGEEGIGRN